MSNSSANNPTTTASAPANEPDSSQILESEEQIAQRRALADAATDHRFRGWRLLGVVGMVVVLLAVASAVVDWLVIGPLEGRMF